MSYLTSLVLFCVFALGLTAEVAQDSKAKRLWWFDYTTEAGGGEGGLESGTTEGWDICDWWSWWCYEEEEGDGGWEPECAYFDSWSCFFDDYCYATVAADGCEQCICTSPPDQGDELQDYIIDMLYHFADEARLIYNMAYSLEQEIYFLHDLTRMVEGDDYDDYYYYYKRASEQLKKRRVARDLKQTKKRHLASEMKKQVVERKRNSQE